MLFNPESVLSRPFDVGSRDEAKRWVRLCNVSFSFQIIILMIDGLCFEATLAVVSSVRAAVQRLPCVARLWWV